MPRVLVHPKPSSAIARLLNAESVSRALKPVSLDPAPLSSESPNPVRAIEANAIKREFVLTAETAALLDAIVDKLRCGTQTRLSASHVLRSLLQVVRPTLTSLDAVAARSRPWKLPPNGSLHHAERVEYEQCIADVIVNALHNHGPARTVGDA